jgi:hypothetical protein
MLTLSITVNLRLLYSFSRQNEQNSHLKDWVRALVTNVSVPRLPIRRICPLGFKHRQHLFDAHKVSQATQPVLPAQRELRQFGAQSAPLIGAVSRQERHQPEIHSVHLRLLKSDLDSVGLRLHLQP